MSAGRRLLSNLLPSARERLRKIGEEQRGIFWGQTQLKLRVRKYPKAGGGERVSLVQPQFNVVPLYSQALQRAVEVTITPEMLRHVESRGGLDAYLLDTPDCKLHSDVASGLKWEVMCKVREQQQQRGDVPRRDHPPAGGTKEKH